MASVPSSGGLAGTPSSCAAFATPVANAAAPTATRTPVVSLHGLQRARSTIADFCRSYLPLHGLTVEDGLLRFADTLVYVSASLYELDEANERLCAAPGFGLAEPPTSTTTLAAALAECGLLDDDVAAELRAGEAFWAAERAFAAALSAGAPLSPAAFDAAAEAKSFDYRVLHRVLLRLLGCPVDDALFAFLRLDERLVDLGDDFTDYEDDVEAGAQRGAGPALNPRPRAACPV